MTNRFLIFKTKKGFEDKLAEVPWDSIVFIKTPIPLIWTHGIYFGGTTKIETPSEVINTENLVKRSDLQYYQEKLRNGINIKTINGIDLLGSGDISISTSRPGRDYDLANDTRDGLMSAQSYTDLQSLKSLVPILLNDIEALQDLIDPNSPDITEIVEKYQAIVDFINNLEDDDTSSALSNLIQSIENLLRSISTETTRATTVENRLSSRISTIEALAEDNTLTEKFNALQLLINSLQENDLTTIINSLLNIVEQYLRDPIKHSILTESQYLNLSQYDNDTIYFITEDTNEPVGSRWVFGQTFPITLTGSWAFGLNFPIILN